MATRDDDKKPHEEFLPTDERIAIYDTQTKTLYLYARGKFPRPTLISFILEHFVMPPRLVYDFKGFYVDGEGKSEEIAFAQKFAVESDPSVVFFRTGDKGSQPIEVKVLSIPIIQGA